MQTKIHIISEMIKNKHKIVVLNNVLRYNNYSLDPINGYVCIMDSNDSESFPLSHQEIVYFKILYTEITGNKINEQQKIPL